MTTKHECTCTKTEGEVNESHSRDCWVHNPLLEMSRQMQEIGGEWTVSAGPMQTCTRVVKEI